MNCEEFDKNVRVGSMLITATLQDLKWKPVFHNGFGDDYTVQRVLGGRVATVTRVMPVLGANIWVNIDLDGGKFAWNPAAFKCFVEVEDDDTILNDSVLPIVSMCI